MTALAIGLAVIVVLLGLRLLLMWLVVLVELVDQASTYDPFPVRQGGSCSRVGESQVCTAPAASLVPFHGETNIPQERRDHV